MYGEDVGDLQIEVYSMFNSNSSTYFFRSQKQGDRWKEALFSVTMDQSMKEKGYKVIFTSKHQTSSHSRGDIALDDFELKAGKCPDTKGEPNALCTFDDYDCGFHQGLYSGMKWEWKSKSRNSTYFPSKTTSDHTLGTAFGGYWFIGSYRTETNHQFSNLKTPVYAKPKQAINCLHFYYNINANFTDWSSWFQEESLKRIYLEVDLFVTYKRRNVLIKVENTTALGQWHLIEVKAEITESYYLAFDATINTQYEVVMAIDDVQMFPGDCSETDRCNNLICKNGGRCYVENKREFCRCPRHFKGENCEIDICSLITCENNATCIIEGGKAVCNCTEKYQGDKCDIDKCSFITCENNGECIIEGGKGVCNCTEKYLGDKCDIDKCSLIACENKGTCMIEVRRAVCKCTEKYTGDKCDIDKCSLITCENSGTCSVEAGRAICTCTSRYTGDKCDIDKCSFRTCKNNGKCVIEVGRAVCACMAQYTGDKCDIDKCSLFTCENSGTCIMEVGRPVCTCMAQYTGDKCHIDKCSLLTCENSGKCLIVGGKAVCNCTSNYTGDKCDVEKCSFITCKNGGKCEIKRGKATCSCANEYAGEFCEKISNKCYQSDSKSASIVGGVMGMLLILILIAVAFLYRKLQKSKNDKDGDNTHEYSLSDEICLDPKNEDRDIHLEFFNPPTENRSLQKNLCPE